MATLDECDGPFIATFTHLLRQIAADYLCGAELPDLADDHGLSLGALEEALVQVGFLPIGSMARQYWRRVPMARIADDHGVNERTLYRLLARYGIERHGGPRKDLPLSPAQIADRYLRGRDQQQNIAAELGVSPHTISRRLREAGVQVPIGARPLALPVRQIRERRNEGERILAIAAAHGVSDPTIRRVLRRGIRPPLVLPPGDRR
ncbi:hypothetical protein ACH4FX_37490 [Streptomyces sp. NPDC018019]|uniref:hypothetical protein n=1 Tax=Streptomyces sp. NPDC018019 TaxID=3365030 RepID=UPI0037BD5F3C